MKRIFTFVLLLIIMVGCGKKYETTQAKIVETQIEKRDDGKYFLARFEYNVDGQSYQDTLELNVLKTITDTLLTPMQGVTFDIEFNVDDPNDILFEYRVKPQQIKIVE